MIPDNYMYENSCSSDDAQNELYNEMFGKNKTKLMDLCCRDKVSVYKINTLHDDIGKSDSFKTTALMYYCLYSGESVDIINALSDEISMQDIEGYTALMNLMNEEHDHINIDCVNALSNEIGMKNVFNETALDLFCNNIYKKIDRDLANQIVYILRSEYKPNHYYNRVDIESIID